MADITNTSAKQGNVEMDDVLRYELLSQMVLRVHQQEIQFFLFVILRFPLTLRLVV